MRIVIAIPVLNEEAVLQRNVQRLVRAVTHDFPYDEVRVVIADNGSTDGTARIAADLAAMHASGSVCVSHLRLEARGKGRAIRAAWRNQDADVYAFMDADLATDLSALPALIASAARSNGVAFGSRAHRDSRVRRSPLRRFVSFGYRTVLGLAFDTDVADAPCGFKAASADAVRRIMPLVKDNAWFFDTEFLLRAERAGIPAVAVPVIWRDEPQQGRQTKVRIAKVAGEYLACVFRLRRTLPPAPRVVNTSRVSRREWTVVAALTALLALLTLVPPVVGLVSAARAGVQWNGRSFISPADFGVYLTYITQAADGAWGLRNLFTTEALLPVPNVLWMAVGWLSALTGTSAIAAFHLARVLLLAPLAFAAYRGIAHFLAAPAERLTAFGLLLFGSGIGLFTAPFASGTQTLGGYEWPTDLWVSEANVFMSALYSPHFVASWTLLIAAAALLCAAYDRRSVRLGAFAGALGLLLFQFHPFHAATLYAAGGITLLARAFRDGYRPRQWAAYAAFVLLSTPTFAYHLWLACCTVNGSFMLGTNVTETPSFVHVVAGFGVIGALAAVGWWRERTPSSLLPAHRAFLGLWALTHLCLAYAPFALQRRLLQGLAFPLVVLAAPALLAAAKALGFRAKGARNNDALLALGAIAVLLPSTATAFIRAVGSATVPDGIVREGVIMEENAYFFGADEAAALAWLRAETAPDAVVLALPDTGNGIAGWAMRPVHVGHWANTVDVERKHAETVAFFRVTATSQERASYAARNGIDFVWVGRRERALGGDALAADPGFEVVFSVGAVAVYAPR